MKPGQGQGSWIRMLQQLQLRLQFFFIEAGQCLGQIFGNYFGQFLGIEPLGCIQGCSRHCRQCYEARAGPGELNSGASTVAVAVAVCLHWSRSGLRAEIWHLFRQIAVVVSLAGIQGCSKHCRQCYEARAGPGTLKSSAATVVVAVCLHWSRSVPRADIWYQFWADCRDRAIGMYPGKLQALQAMLSSEWRARGA